MSWVMVNPELDDKIGTHKDGGFSNHLIFGMDLEICDINDVFALGVLFGVLLAEIMGDGFDMLDVLIGIFEGLS